MTTQTLDRTGEAAVYRAKSVDMIENPDMLSAEPELSEFALDLANIWNPSL